MKYNQSVVVTRWAEQLRRCQTPSPMDTGRSWGTELRSRASNRPPQRARGRPLRRRWPAAYARRKVLRTPKGCLLLAPLPPPAGAICSVALAPAPRTAAAVRPPSAALRVGTRAPAAPRTTLAQSTALALDCGAPGAGAAPKRGLRKSLSASPGTFRLCWSFRFVFWTRPAWADQKSSNTWLGRHYPDKPGF